MYHSTFLVNRQMITDPGQIKSALMKYSSTDGTTFSDFFYRLEWYRIGISIPMDVYSTKEPLLKLVPECQLTGTGMLEDLSPDTDVYDFKIFIIPYKNTDKNEDLDHSFINSWLQKKLGNNAKIIESELGPNNRIYYKTNPTDAIMEQIQSYTLRGKLKCKNLKKLDEIRQKPIGYYHELGCGLLMIE